MGLLAISTIKKSFEFTSRDHVSDVLPWPVAMNSVYYRLLVDALPQLLVQDFLCSSPNLFFLVVVMFFLYTPPYPRIAL